MTYRILNLSAEAFAPYGTIINHSSTGDRFQVIVDEPDAPGWRIAVNKVTRQSITNLGCHPNTRESFEPLSGISIIVVSPQEDPEQIVAFLLDQPICLYKNVWHATISLTETALIKITENHHVESKAYPLQNPINFGLIREKE